MENTYYYSHLARHLSHFCHVMQGFDRTTPTPLLFTKCRNHFFLDIRLADENKEHEEASEKVEAVNDSEEDLNIARIFFTGGVAVIAMDEIMEKREGPENAKDWEEFAVENLEKKLVN